MLRLLKYEMRKTLMSKLILLGISAVAQIIFLYGVWTDKENPAATGAVMLFFIAITGITIIGVLSLVTLHRDMNTRQGYMLFMTPNSCYRILGAKVLECGLSILITGAFFFALGLLDFSLILDKGANQSIWDMINRMLQSINENIQIDAPHIAAVIFLLLTSWLCTVTTAYLSDVVSSSLLNGKKANWIVTFLLFLVLNYIISKVLTLVPSSFDVITYLLLQGALSLVIAGVMYVVTAKLMEKYLSV